MRRLNSTLTLAATDLTNHLACAHLTQQRLAIARGERNQPRPAESPHADLIRARGREHEEEQLALLSAEAGGEHVEIASEHPPGSAAGVEACAAQTSEAIRAGVPLIHQAQFLAGHWQGRADFLRLRDHSYEVLDTKLARHVKPAVVHQLSLYSRLLAEIQGTMPRYAYVILGDGTREPIELARYAALHRHVTRQLDAITAAPAQLTYPNPVAHCGICDLEAECIARLREDDHLSFVANARRQQRDVLAEELGIDTLQALADASPEDAAARAALGAERFELLRNQAHLQALSRADHQPHHSHREPVRAAGYSLLPRPTPGDVFFDLEGDPYVNPEGLEYLWGWHTPDGVYEHAWAHEPAAERAALERFVDRVAELRAEHPGMHVFHYAPHERSKLQTLAMHYATREREVDELLRAGVLVDLLAVVRQALQVGEERYSLKALERHHGFVRHERSVREGGGSIVAYEAWLDTGDDALLESIRAYNEEDCRSTQALRDWLLERMLPEAERELEVDFDELREPEQADYPGPRWLPPVEALAARLQSGLPVDAGEDTDDQAELRLLSHVLLYHYREDKPAWWRYFALRATPLDQLIDERDAVGGMELDTSVAPVPIKSSLAWSFVFPRQEHKLAPRYAANPAGDRVTAVEIGERTALVKRAGSADPPHVPALIAGGPPDPAPVRRALVALSESVLAGDDRFAASRALLRREPPRLAAGVVLGEEIEALNAAVLALDRSVLPIQGPPGTGKSFRAARMVIAALRAGKRVGITAQSHAVIRHVLGMVEECADEQGFVFAGFYKGDEYDSRHGLVDHRDSNDAVSDDHQLVAGTAWLFCRDEHREAFDVVFIDEAGQFSLAAATAVGTAAHNLVCLGDPQQLPQVTQAEHPHGSDASILEHVLGEADTIAPEQGVLLTESWRMHPAVCSFVSERSYDSKLRSRDACSLRAVEASAGVLTGTGLRTLAVEHSGRSQASPEEAEAIAAACSDLLSAPSTVTDDEGRVRPLRPEDILVVAPYNLAVRTIAAAVSPGVRVGTVDKFQGQEAPVVFYALTCSSGEDVPRGLDFLFDKNRLNVAVSRAQCLAVLVYSPRLLDADCKTLAAMELLDGVCRFVELAEGAVVTPEAPASGAAHGVSAR